MTPASKEVAITPDPLNPAVVDLSPLDRIRLVEAEVARQLVATREAAEENIIHVRTQAEQLKAEAREAGRKEGETHYKQILANAEEEAQAIVAQAQHRAHELRQRGQQRMEQITLTAINIVTGQEGAARLDEH